MATRAARTAPKEKNTESAVTRYSFPRGICSKRRVPSVGMDPFESVSIHGGRRGKCRKTHPNSAAEEKERYTEHRKSVCK